MNLYITQYNKNADMVNIKFQEFKCENLGAYERYGMSPAENDYVYAFKYLYIHWIYV